MAICWGCEDFSTGDRKFDNSVYLDVSATDDVQLATFSNNKAEVSRDIKAVLVYPAEQDVKVTLGINPSLAADYNLRHGTSLPMLDAKYYTLSPAAVTIPAGKVESQPVQLLLSGLTGEDEAQTGALPLDKAYLLPVRIEQATMDIMQNSATAYYVVKRSSAITTAAFLGDDNWISFPTLPDCTAWDNLTAVTFEALIYIDKFSDNANISTIMGVEQYLLLRIGDTGFPRRQLQVSAEGFGMDKFPAPDKTHKSLETGRWYHVAYTYDMETRVARLYVDGRLQSEMEDMGPATISDDNKLNPADQKGDKFLIGNSFDQMKRPLNGNIAEARVWSVARTEEQIWDNMYRIGNPLDEPTLIGYWKFNEGRGNNIKDWSMYKNDGVANRNLTWPEGIEISEINKEEE